MSDTKFRTRYIAIGFYSRDVYTTGYSKAEVIRTLKEIYPYKITAVKNISSLGIYPEPLIVETNLEVVE